MFIIKGKSMSEDLKTKLSLLNNLIESKTNAVNAHIENLKKLEGYSFAGREITAKFNSYLTQQASEIQALAVSQKISQEIASVALTILENFKKIVKETEEESMKIFFVKQGETLAENQDLTNLLSIKKTLNDEIEKSALQPVVTQAVEAIVEGEVKETKKKRVRPDKDLTTRVGRAALDLAERRKKHKKTSA
jgi:hypothetical protein